MCAGGAHGVVMQRVSYGCCCPGLWITSTYVRGCGGDTTINQGSGTWGDGSSEVLERMIAALSDRRNDLSPEMVLVVAVDLVWPPSEVGPTPLDVDPSPSAVVEILEVTLDFDSFPCVGGRWFLAG